MESQAMIALVRWSWRVEDLNDLLKVDYECWEGSRNPPDEIHAQCAEELITESAS
jgi:hypothetical protein